MSSHTNSKKLRRRKGKDSRIADDTASSVRIVENWQYVHFGQKELPLKPNNTFSTGNERPLRSSGCSSQKSAVNPNGGAFGYKGTLRKALLDRRQECRMQKNDYLVL